MPRDRELRAVVPVALIEVMQRLVPDFEKETGCKVVMVHMLNPEVPAYAREHDDWDIAFTNPEHVDEMVAAGATSEASRHPLGRAPLALAARAPANGPPCQTSEAIAEILRGATRIAYTGEGTSGRMFQRLIERLDLDLPDRTIGLEGGGPMRALLAGKVDLAALPLTNIAPVEGAAAIAICPPDWQVHIDLAACLNPDASPDAHSFSSWLRSAPRVARLERLGALPGT